jgi:hypothetical protein
MTHDDQLDLEGGNTEMPPCRNCGESWRNHSSTNQCPIGYVPDSGSGHYEPMTKEDFLDEWEGKL